MNAMRHRLERTLFINANRDIVFNFFTDDARWASWWGAGSTIDPTVGGRVYIRHPGNVEVVGEVLEVRAPERIVFTYGYQSGTPFGPGESRVTIHLEAAGEGTRLYLSHEFAEESALENHVQGWRYQLSLFANAVANEQYAAAGDLVDAWFAAWQEADPARRQQQLATIALSDIRFFDRYSAIEGLDELALHIGAAQRFMPGITMRRSRDVRHCQGTVLADWVAVGNDGGVLMSGSNVFLLAANGRIAAVTGLADPPRQ